MGANISKLAIKKQAWHSNMTRLNHLGESLKAKPEVFGEVMDQMFSSQVYSENPLTALLMKTTSTQKEIGGLEWEWNMKGATRKPGVVTKNINPTAAVFGTYNTSYKLALDCSDFKIGDVLAPAGGDKIYQSRIQSAPVAQGSSWIYTLKLVTNDSQLGVPKAYFQPNQEWIKMFSTYGEGAEMGGSVTFADNLAFRNRLSKFRKSYKITDYAAEEVLAVSLMNAKGAKAKSWMPYAETIFWKQWYKELEIALWYSRKSDNVADTTGEMIRSFPGVQEQLEDSHTHKYSNLSARLIEEYLMDIFYSRVSPGKSRQIEAWTGEYGMIQFHKAIEKATSPFLKNVEVYSSKVASPMHQNSLAFGYQFTEYRMANGAVLKLNHNPLYDDRSINSEIDPVTGYPKESMRFTFLDLSGEAGESNIQMVKKKNAYKFWYVDGGLSHLGPKNGGSSAHEGEYYSMNVSDHRGLHIKDVSKCGELILSRQ